MRARPLRLLVVLLIMLAALRPGDAAPVLAPHDPQAPRAQRSANLSHITGTSRKIQMFLKNRHLQLLPDGTVNGTADENSEYTILQRTTVSIGQLKIQGVATCLYLCMDACGNLYAHKDFNEECVFTEQMEQHNYNTYSRNSSRHVSYVALNAKGQPRRLQLPPGRVLGKLSTYAKTLTRPAPAHHRARHRHQCSKHIRKHQMRPPKQCRKRQLHPPPQKKVAPKKFQEVKKKKRHRPKKVGNRGKGKHTTTTDRDWDDTSTLMSTSTDAEFFRTSTALEAVDPEP